MAAIAEYCRCTRLDFISSAGTVSNHATLKSSDGCKPHHITVMTQVHLKMFNVIKPNPSSSSE